MKAYLLTWNQDKFPWDFKKKLNYWSTGTNKSLKKGDYFFIIKLGKRPKGLVAFGKVLSHVIDDMEWNFKSTPGPGVKIKILEKEDPKTQCVVNIDLLKQEFPGVNWSSQNCISIPDDVFIELLQLWTKQKIKSMI